MSYSSPSPEGPISAAEPLTSPAGPPDEIESVSGADQLLSSAFVNGLSDPYDPAQGGWTSGPLPSDPYTGLAMGGDAYTGGPAGDHLSLYFTAIR